jgi:dTDP-4-amino-4,6-dideoxygalactose transaminase
MTRSCLSLWPRGRLDLTWRDLLYAALAPAWPSAVDPPIWPDAPPHLVTLSVRTAWDALLAVHDWPRGSEVIFSEANIPDMVELITVHGFVPVAVPLDPATLAVDAREVAQRITARTRAILMSPLFGTRMPLAEIGALARAHRLLLVEDNAQAYAGPDWHGSPEADVALFSFGLIKTCTALGGAVVFVREETLAEKLRLHLETYRRVTAGPYYYKWARAVLLHALAHRPWFGLFRQLLETCGLDPDAWLIRATRGFQGVELLKALRRQPHRATVHLLRRRLETDTPARVASRLERGRRSITALPSALAQLASHDACWALPVRVSQRDAFATHAREAGFDLSHRASSLRCHGDLSSSFARAMEEVLYLPITTPMPDSEWQRLLDLVRQAAPPAEKPPL